MLGIYDSGLGGLCALRAVRKLLPDEDIIYLADTAHLPYGTRGEDTIASLAERATHYLCESGAHAILCACGTVSSVALERIRGELPVPICGVVEPSVIAASRIAKSKKIGVLGTSATIHSEKFPQLIRKLMPSAEIICRACDMFVPIVENGFSENETVSREVARVYLQGLDACDTVIMGCTHFPHLARYIQEAAPRAILIDSAHEGAREITRYAEGGEGITRFLATDISPKFLEIAERFLGEKISAPKKIQI